MLAMGGDSVLPDQLWNSIKKGTDTIASLRERIRKVFVRPREYVLRPTKSIAKLLQHPRISHTADKFKNLRTEKSHVVRMTGTVTMRFPHEIGK